MPTMTPIVLTDESGKSVLTTETAVALAIEDRPARPPYVPPRPGGFGIRAGKGNQATATK